MLSKSNTSKTTSTPPRSDNPLDTPVQFLKGVGPRLSVVFNQRDIRNVRDMLYFFPRKYEDRSQMSLLRTAEPGSTVSIELTAKQTFMRPLRGRFSKLLEVKATDKENQWISLKWFRFFKGFDKKFESGTPFIAIGQIKVFGSSGREMVHPEIQFDTGDDLHVGRIVPVYTEIEGIPTKTLRRILDSAIHLGVDALNEELPSWALVKHRLPNIGTAIREIHFPSENYSKDETGAFANFRSPAHQRLIYEEFFKFEYHVIRQKLNHEKEKGPTLDAKKLAASLAGAKKKLPYTLTAGQDQSLKDIFTDLTQPHPMNRLLQGDVGAGKTAVALLTSFAAMDQGFQVALMAPTEILAEQHYNNILKFFGATAPVKMLVGKTPAAERRVIQARLDAGEAILIVGTHALIEDPVKFKRLGLVIIDEQHRFGVDQRRKLREKAIEQTGQQPHTLVMTATPIPRTLALTAYGDLAVSTIRDRPPGRMPIKTHLVHAGENAKMTDFIRKQLQEGRQAYYIFPLVNDSEEEGFTHLTSAVSAAETLANETYPEFKVGLLHGKLSANEKAAIMERFRRNEVQVLVSTTVVEVGVDVPNATVMVIEHAERFGLSQLHQLRGRIGRGRHASTCFLKTGRPPHIPTPERLEVMCETEDGFKIAEADLELRGPGEFLGTRQSGALPFKIASLVRDQDWLLKARDDVLDLLKNDPDLKTPENVSFKRYVESKGRVESAHLKTS
ncbi:MAG: ATP-dependent DNA helicase RecG [Bdellovibrionales bacterium]|nr:ATP-dependent DNA helicase RecG [Bdellovibrionales bacterium]